MQVEFQISSLFSTSVLANCYLQSINIDQCAWKRQKLLNANHVQALAMNFQKFPTWISLRIHHHFANFKLPIDPGYVLFNLAMLVFKILEQWRFSILDHEWCPVLPPSSSFISFSFFLQIQTFYPLFSGFAKWPQHSSFVLNASTTISP